MRNPDRLFNFYTQIAVIHAKKFPDWREGQLWFNFLHWIQAHKGVDPFYSETDEMIKYFKEFAGIKEETNDEKLESCIDCSSRDYCTWYYGRFCHKHPAE